MLVSRVMTTSESFEVSDAAAVFLHGRAAEAFPALTDDEIARIRHHGTLRRYEDGEALFKVGRPRKGMFVILSGRLAITARDGLGRTAPVVDQGPGQFAAELGTLGDDAVSLTDGHAVGEVEALLLSPEKLRALIVEESELGERIMRALILRRVALVQLGEGGTLLIGTEASRDLVRLEEFLRRNGQPHHVIDPSVAAARDVVARTSPAPSELPLVVCPNGDVLRNPSESALAHALGLIGTREFRPVYDVAIVGCGPAGLSTAVYAASEGLSVIVLDAHAFGGQAGASARIENYLGFPTGITGLALVSRAYAQARKFGADIAIPVDVEKLECGCADGSFRLLLDDGRRVVARAVVVASGARYRRPAIENLADFEGRGVWYWASPLEAKLCAGQEVVLVGGGNSAGQAADFLAGHCAKVRMLVRGPGLAKSMSSYLVQRLAARPNVDVMTETEIVALEGSPERGLERVTWRSRGERADTTAPIRNVFLFLGAEPSTAWLEGCGVALDAHGFVVTGTGESPLASTLPGVFAVGDVRAGSVKRVGSAIGEGAQVVVALHSVLAAEARERPAADVRRGASC